MPAPLLVQTARRLISGRERSPPSIEDGVRIYAIGDIHGRADLLREILCLIEGDCVGASERRQLVFLGDYIDRGPDSRGVIEICLELQQRDDIDACFLMGNHERAALDFLADPANGQAWLRFGGMETLASYQVQGATPDLSPELASEIAHSFRRRLPKAHLRFLEGLTHWRRSGSYFFCHAGVHPYLAPDNQPKDILLWGAPQYLDQPWRTGLFVVHGHYAGLAPVVREHRIGIDTAAFATGRLTALRLIGREAFFFQTGPV